MLLTSLPHQITRSFSCLLMTACLGSCHSTVPQTDVSSDGVATSPWVDVEPLVSTSSGPTYHVIDGYDSMNYFHCNWGWGGSSNGYFYLDPVNPESISFIEDQAALLNILPEGFEAPFALFDFEVNNLEVTFDDLSSIVNVDEIVNWFWDFGDGEASNDQSPIYSYADYYLQVL